MPHDLPHFWRRRTFTSYLLLPLSALFALITACRRALYRAGILRQYRAPVPVLIVGNISVGGNGKTPLVQALARAFQAEGIAVGIISRGYGGTAREATDVATCADAAIVGDEPLMLWHSTGVPVVVARKRAEAAQKLLRDYPATRLILADDGLQHYALARDAEIAVIAADFGLGNGWLMPAGPLRESAARLKRVDAVVHSGAGQGRAGGYSRPPKASYGVAPLRRTKAYCLQRRALSETFGERLYILRYASDGVRPLGGGVLQPLARLNDCPLYALTAIARPERLFNSLRAQGAELAATRSLPDHAAIPADAAAFAEDGWLVISGKDAVKTAAWPEALKTRTFVVDYRAVLPPELLPALRCKLGV